MEGAKGTGWTRTARWLHWGMAAAIAVEVPAGIAMAWTYGPPGRANEGLHITASQVHHTLGLLLLAAVLVRVGWRFSHPAPPLPDTMPKWQKRAALAVQAILYALLLAIPLTGYAAVSSLADVEGFGATHLWLFGHDGFAPGGWIPRLVPPVAYDGPELLGYTLFGPAHRYLLYFGAAVLAVHVFGALHHLLLLRDGILARMLGR